MSSTDHQHRHALIGAGAGFLAGACVGASIGIAGFGAAISGTLPIGILGSWLGYRYGAPLMERMGSTIREYSDMGSFVASVIAVAVVIGMLGLPEILVVLIPFAFLCAKSLKKRDR